MMHWTCLLTKFYPEWKWWLHGSICRTQASSKVIPYFYWQRNVHSHQLYSGMFIIHELWIRNEITYLYFFMARTWKSLNIFLTCYIYVFIYPGVRVWQGSIAKPLLEEKWMQCLFREEFRICLYKQLGMFYQKQQLQRFWWECRLQSWDTISIFRHW